MIYQMYPVYFHCAKHRELVYIHGREYYHYV